MSSISIPRAPACFAVSLFLTFATTQRAQDWKQRVTTLPLAVPQKGVTFDAAAWTATSDGIQANGTKALRVEFIGNRVDVTGLAGGTGSARILLDGQVPSTLPDTLAASRSDLAPGAWWAGHQPRHARKQSHRGKNHDEFP